MSDSLRDRIARELDSHGLGWINNGTSHAWCYCGYRPRLGESWHLHVADAVIAELGLRPEWTWTYPDLYGETCYGFICDTREEAHAENGGLPEGGIAYRYVTDWNTERGIDD